MQLEPRDIMLCTVPIIPSLYVDSPMKHVNLTRFQNICVFKVISLHRWEIWAETGILYVFSHIQERERFRSMPIGPPIVYLKICDNISAGIFFVRCDGSIDSVNPQDIERSLMEKLIKNSLDACDLAIEPS